MNRERARSLLPIIQAFADGKDIECREASYDQKWMGDDSLDPDFAFHDHLEYRIKAREFWLYPIGIGWRGVDSEDKAKPYSGVFKVRRVIE